jgi:hypothetical protein
VSGDIRSSRYIRNVPFTAAVGENSVHMKSPDGGQQRKTERQQWDELVAELDLELITYKPVRYQMGKILYKMKVHLKKHGLDKGRKGRWQSILRERELAETTAKEWVVKYQKAEGIPLAKCFYPEEMKRAKRTRNLHKYGQKKTAVSVALAEKCARVEAAEDNNPDYVDNSDSKRGAVECIFVLTQAEKFAFMEAVKQLSELRATQVMYQAVIAAANGGKA